jgi:hypothetical protein
MEYGRRRGVPRSVVRWGDAAKPTTLLPPLPRSIQVPFSRLLIGALQESRPGSDGSAHIFFSGIYDVDGHLARGYRGFQAIVSVVLICHSERASRAVHPRGEPTKRGRHRSTVVPGDDSLSYCSASPS